MKKILVPLLLIVSLPAFADLTGDSMSSALTDRSSACSDAKSKASQAAERNRRVEAHSGQRVNVQIGQCSCDQNALKTNWTCSVDWSLQVN